MKAINSVSEKDALEDFGSHVAEQIKNRKLKQVFLGITGPLGSGATLSAAILAESLERRGFQVEKIKVSKLIESVISSKISKDAIPSEIGAERVLKLQKKGDELREKVHKHITAKLICAEIASRRVNTLGNDHEDDFEKQNKKIAFVIDSIKNDKEVEFLKLIYQESFFLFGLITTEDICKTRLKQKGLEAGEISKLISAEVYQNDKDGGQTVIKCLEQADFFIRNDIAQRSLLEQKLERCLDLIFSSKLVTPTQHESGMYHAYVAGARSACLSRQVGASITDSSGEVLATGCNDVPRATGGLYNQENSKDQRCYLKGGKCYNDYHKRRLLRRIFVDLKKQGIAVSFADPTKDSKGDPYQTAEDVMLNAGLKDLIEFSRAVHAEMDAILQLARNERGSTRNAVMYTTTYPCHSCARHIVAAGITEVYYVEPYKKSLATDLHDDSISTDGIDPTKVGFIPYEGVSPKRYLGLFKKQGWKEKGTGVMKIPARDLLHEDDAIPFDKFYEIESKAIKHLKDYLQ